jgi:cysteine-rich repeat protein
MHGRHALRTGAFAAIASACLLAGTASAATVQFSTVIDGAQETPPTFTGAIGSGTFTMDTIANTLAINVVITVPPPSGETMAHIHGFAAPGVPAGILFSLPLGSPKIAVWSFTEAQEADIIAGLTYVNIHSTAFPAGEFRGQVLRAPSCGDALLDGGEDCDDGNNTNGDCCDASCQFEAMGSPCADGPGLCDIGACDSEGECVQAPAAGCKTALKSSLLIKDDLLDDTKDKMIFKWLKGAQTDVSEFGAPTGTTAYALCLYAGPLNTQIGGAEVSADALLWIATATGFKYKDPAGIDDGIQKVILKAGAADQSKALAKGKGENLPDLDPGPATLPVMAQLINSDGVCFEGVFDTTDVIRNEAGLFKAKAQ